MNLINSFFWVRCEPKGLTYLFLFNFFLKHDIYPCIFPDSYIPTWKSIHISIWYAIHCRSLLKQSGSTLGNSYNLFYFLLLIGCKCQNTARNIWHIYKCGFNCNKINTSIWLLIRNHPDRSKFPTLFIDITEAWKSFSSYPYSLSLLDQCIK